MKSRTRSRRKVTDVTLRVLMLACVVIALVPLASILATTIEQGGRVISWHFLTSAEPIPCSVTNATPTCPYGGMWPAIEGSFVMLSVAALIAMPIGILAGVYLAEFGQHRIGRTASFLVDVLSGVPSIIVGLSVFSVFLLLSSNPEDVFSAFSGSVGLAIIMLPVVVRTTEESLRLVPRNIREAAAALGIPRWKATLRIVVPTGGSAIVTGAILASARAGGDAAVLIFTAFGNRLGFIGFNHPAEAIPVLIYQWGQSGVGNWVSDAWGMSFVLIMIMLALSLTARLILARRARLLGGGG
jgi:phosphate transport system permease protein